MKSFISISKNGKIKTFYNDFNFLEKEIKTAKVKRVSHIVPENLFLRILFRILRFLFPDTSFIAEWTRKWKCKWIVVFTDGECFGPFENREDAIVFERKYYVEKKLRS